LNLFCCQTLLVAKDKILPLSFYPPILFSLQFDVVTERLSSDCLNNACFIVIQNSWDFGIATNLFLSGISEIASDLVYLHEILANIPRYTSYYRNFAGVKETLNSPLKKTRVATGCDSTYQYEVPL